LLLRKPDIDPDALRALLVRVLGLPARAVRTQEGVATQGYRVDDRGRVLYLRVAEEANDDLTVDAQVFERLRAEGVRVPEIVQ
jgi:hypothetical protein